MGEDLSLNEKKLLFWFYDIPFALFISCVVIIIISIISAIGLCALFDGGIQLDVGNIPIAICGEAIPTLVLPLPILILVIFFIAIWRLKIRYNNLEQKEMSKFGKWLKLVLGILFWLLFLYIAYILGIVLLDFLG